MFIHPPDPDALLDEMFGPAVAPADVDVVAWIEKNFFIPETPDRRIILQPYHKAVLREALRKDENGLYVYSLVVWSDIKKSIKSTIAAAVGMHRAATTDWGGLRVVANNLKQADSRVAMYMRRALELNKPWAGRNVEKITPSGYLIEMKNHARIEAIPINPEGEAGGNDVMIIWSELWGAENKAAERLWTELVIPPALFGKGQRWIETYAGFSGESLLLERLYDAGVGDGRKLDLSFTDRDGFHDLADLEVFANDNARMLCLWNTRPRCPWQSDDYYRQQAMELAPSEFDRVHGNKWSSASAAYIPIEWYDACKTPLLPMRPDQGMVVGIDAAVSGDCFGIVGLTRDNGKSQVRFVRIWTPPKGGAIKFSNQDDPEDITTPEGVCRWLARTYPVVEFAFDSYQLVDFTQRLGRAGVGWFRPFSQQAERLRGDKMLYDNIRDRRIEWDESVEGIDELRRHLLNADAKSENEKMRIVKRAASGRPIDGAVALGMANAELRRLNLD